GEPSRAVHGNRPLRHRDRRRRGHGGGQARGRPRARPGRGDVAVLRDAGRRDPRRRSGRGSSARRDRTGRAAMDRGGPVSATDPKFEQLLEYVRDERGFDYTGYRRPSLMRRFEKRMQSVGAADWEAYRAYLRKHDEEFAELFNTILINVTGFFRDAETWEIVANEVI